MINDLDETIKQLLIEGVPLDIAEVDVVFDAPTKEWSGSLARPTLNCYLYHVVENTDLRNLDWEMERAQPTQPEQGRVRVGAIRRKLPSRIDAHYTITAWANLIEDEHRLLWRSLAALMRFRQIPQEKLQGVLAEQEWPIPIKVAQQEGPFKNPSDLWSSLETHVKPGVQLTVTLPLDPDLFLNVPLVLTRRVLTHPMWEGAETYELPASQIGGWVLVDAGAEPPRPMPGADVRLVERGLSVSTDEQGRFKFPRVPHGSHTLRATHPSGAQAERRIEVPGDGYDLVLRGREGGPTTGGEQPPPADGGDRDQPSARTPTGKARRR